MNKSLKFTNILIGILFSLFLISAGLFLSINFRALYYFDIHYLNIIETSGFDKATILANYNALIDYCSPFYTGKLVFPTFPASPSGLYHFEEVKKIFNYFFYIGIISFSILVPTIIFKYKKKDTSFLKVSSIVSIVLPAIVGIGCAINFDRAFVIFHKVFFRNDYWLFDPVTDPVITILPDTYFLHCAIVIIIFVIIGSIILYSLGHYFSKNHKS